MLKELGYRLLEEQGGPVHGGLATMDLRGRLAQFARIITFIDLPIRRKLLLYALGALWWFLVMAVVALIALMTIRTEYRVVVEQTIPRERIAHQLEHDLKALALDFQRLGAAASLDAVTDPADQLRSRLTAMSGQLTALERMPLLAHSDDADTAQQGHIAAFAAELPKLQSTIERAAILREDRIRGSEGSSVDELLAVNREWTQLLDQAQKHVNALDEYATRGYEIGTLQVQETIRNTMFGLASILIMETLLLVLFTHWISNAITRPINNIIGQINALKKGDVDLTQKIEIISRDEIGELSSEFNGLMETVHGMTLFKRVIEEDDSVADVYARLADAFRDHAGLEDFVIYEVSGSRKEMRPVYPLVVAPEELHCSEEILSDCNLCRAEKTGHTISSVDYPHMCRQFSATHGTEHVCIPLMIGGRAGGVVQFLFRREGKGASDRDAIYSRVFKAEGYIKQSLSVIEAKQLMHTLRESSLKDPLTGLYNRRFLQEHTEHLIAGVLRREKEVGLIMCDLDYFKRVNDDHGHDAGDIVLKETAAVIARSIRHSDILIRFGGEEFLAVLIDVDADGLMGVAEKIRENVASHKVKLSGGVVSKTISLGVSRYPTDADTLWRAIKFADVALYNAKDGGRNRSVRFEPSMWTADDF